MLYLHDMINIDNFKNRKIFFHQNKNINKSNFNSSYHKKFNKKH